MPRFLLLLCVTLLASCALKEKLAPYKPDTQQGHLLTPEAVAKLKVGMTREQVRFLLGTPLVNDLFNPDRMFYIYRNQKGAGPVERSNLTLYFEQNKLVRFETDVPPLPAVAVATPDSPVTSVVREQAAPRDPLPAVRPAQETVTLAAAPATATAQRPQSLQPQPQPQPRPAAAPSVASDEKLVSQTIHEWLQAWMKQDVEAYLACYAKDFMPPDREPRGKWEQTRRLRVSQPKTIAIRLSALRIQIADAQTATATFRQDYRSDTYHDTVNKELILVRENGAWRIRQERVVKSGGSPQGR